MLFYEQSIRPRYRPMFCPKINVMIQLDDGTVQTGISSLMGLATCWPMHFFIDTRTWAFMLVGSNRKPVTRAITSMSRMAEILLIIMVVRQSSAYWHLIFAAQRGSFLAGRQFSSTFPRTSLFQNSGRAKSKGFGSESQNNSFMMRCPALMPFLTDMATWGPDSRTWSAVAI